MYPVLFEIGHIKVYSWGFALALSAIVAWYGIHRRFKENGYNTDYVIEMITATVLCGVLGGRVLYILLYQWQELLNHPAAVLDVSRGVSGLVWYGSFTGGFLAFIAFLAYRKLSLLKIADIDAPYLALGYATVRVGCFLNGCCYGKPANSFLGVVFPHIDDLARYPTQLFSSALNLVIFGILMWMYPRRRFDGQVFATYFILYGIYRFIVEFWRENTIYFGSLSWAQVVASGLVALGVLLYAWFSHRAATLASEGK